MLEDFSLVKQLSNLALMAYKKFSVTARSTFKNAKKALQERFKP